MGVMDLVLKANGNPEIQSSFIKALNQYRRHSNIVVSVSGGKDSDLIVDIMSKIDDEKKIRYVWFDTGIEYQATKDHLDYLEMRYGITIERIKAIKPIPLCCKEYGQPFLTKYVSEQLERLQRHDFKWEDKPYEELMELYPGCKSSLKFWCNKHTREGYSVSMFDIGFYNQLKPFIIANPPPFKISNKCCHYAKKKVSHDLIKHSTVDLMITGIRKYEGGIRSCNYKSCTSQDSLCDSFRPIFWYTTTDSKAYDDLFDILHSDCYEVWGFNRTGCVGCPFNSKAEEELEIARQYEPNLYKAAKNIFKDSYEYTRKYKEYIAEYKRQKGKSKNDKR